jgi:hypothetical protein
MGLVNSKGNSLDPMLGYLIPGLVDYLSDFGENVIDMEPKKSDVIGMKAIFSTSFPFSSPSMEKIRPGVFTILNLKAVVFLTGMCQQRH